MHAHNGASLHAYRRLVLHACMHVYRRLTCRHMLLPLGLGLGLALALALSLALTLTLGLTQTLGLTPTRDLGFSQTSSSGPQAQQAPCPSMPR